MDENLFDAAFLGQLEQLRLHFRMRASGQSGGGRPSKQVGVSTEFSDFRDYQLGDDLRRVDWNAYARFGKLILKLFMEERQMHIRLLIDQSASMQMQGKGVMAKRLALCMAYLGLTGYDQVSIQPLGEANAPGFGPVSGRGAFVRAVQFLETVPAVEHTNLLDSVTHLRFSGGPGICYLFTDGFSEDSIQETLAYLRYQKQRTTLVHVLSPQELKPDLEGEIRLIDVEKKTQREVEISPGVLASYDKALKGFCAGLKEDCYRHGFAYEQIASDMDLRQAVLEQLIT